jgi:DNA repair exonuclease SbcCD ATPase subunit
LYAHLKEEFAAAGRLQTGEFSGAAVAPQPIAVQNSVDLGKEGPVTREELHELQNALTSVMQRHVLDLRREMLVALDKASKERAQLPPQTYSARSPQSSMTSSVSPRGAVDDVGGTGPSPTASPFGQITEDYAGLQRIEEEAVHRLVERLQEELADWLEDQRSMLQINRPSQVDMPMPNKDPIVHSLQARMKELEKAMQSSQRKEAVPAAADESGTKSALNTLQGKSRQLESRVTTLEYAAGSAERDAEKLDSIEKDFAKVKEQLEQLQTSMGGLGGAGGGENGFSVAEALEKMNRSMDDRASDEKREMENLYTAVRGGQRESERTMGKLDDVVNGLDALKKRVDVSIPQILNMIEVDGGRPGQEGVEAQKARAKRLEALEGGQVPAPFASLEALQKATHDTDENTKGQLGRLKEDFHDALNGKADSEALHLLAAQLEAALREMRSLMHTLKVSSSSEGSVDNAAFVRLPYLSRRCVSCDKKVDMMHDRANPWDSGAVPNTPWPNRAGHPRSAREAVGRDPLLPRIDGYQR